MSIEILNERKVDRFIIVNIFYYLDNVLYSSFFSDFSLELPFWFLLFLSPQ